MGMGSEPPVPLVDRVNVAVDVSVDGSCSAKRNTGKAPKRIHKLQREKQKREHLNELFLDLATALEMSQPNNGKASILCEATRLLKELLGQIELLNKENVSLLSESQYVTSEKIELREENSSLQSQISELQNELESRMAHSKPDLNAPPSEFNQPEINGLTSTFPRDTYAVPAGEPAMQQRPTILVLPMRPDVQASPQHEAKPVSNVMKPHARYLTAADSWPSQLLGETISSSEEEGSNKL